MTSSAVGRPGPRSGRSRALGLARSTVQHVLAAVSAQRDGTPSVRVRWPHGLDAYDTAVQELLARYPDLTAIRLLEELRQRGFTGGYTTVRLRLRQLRPKNTPRPVLRFETGPGAQAQMDYSPYDIDFVEEGRRRVHVEALATGDFIRRQDNLVLVGQSGVGKSHLIQGLGRAACALGYRVRYTTSAALIEQLTASLADQTLPRQVRKYAAFDWLIVDEFGFDRLERREARDAASLLFKLIDARNQKRATALVTNIDFEGWGEYLGDPPLAMALLDRIVDGAIIVKITGKSYRAHRAQPTANKKAAKA